MRIKKLEIRGFGKLNNLKLSFNDGLNVIYGNNESGKTSIQQFIRAMFFGLSGMERDKNSSVTIVQKYTPWVGNEYTGYMEYVLDNDEVYKVGRNFGTDSVKVIDGLFNDITERFEFDKVKGILFAEKHLGVNEACFDKTVFIKQLDSRIDDNGSKELFNRLTNITQTGFEDISFRKAKEALNEALRRHIGVDKTELRPLDRVIYRLGELKARRADLLEKRDSLFNLEDELSEAILAKERFDIRRLILAKARELLSLRKSIINHNKQMSELERVVNSIGSSEGELKRISECYDEFNRVKEELIKFSTFSNEDVDNITVEYHELLIISDECKKIQVNIGKLREEKNKIDGEIKPLLGFENLGDNIEKNVLALNKDLEHLKDEYKKSNIGMLDEKIKGEQLSCKYINYNIVAAVLATAVLLTTGFTKFYYGFLMAPLGLIAAVVLIYFRFKKTRKLSELLNEKKLMYIVINSVIDEINNKQKALKNILQVVGAENIEDFLRLKALYDSKIQLSEKLYNDAESLEKDLRHDIYRTNELKNILFGKLATAGILVDDSCEITDDHINNFKHGVRCYKGLEPSINYTLQRITDINEYLKELYTEARSLCGKDSDNKEVFVDRIKQVSSAISIENEKVQVLIEEINDLCVNVGMLPYELESFYQRLLNTEPAEIEAAIEEDYNRVSENLSAELLKIQEYETLFKGLQMDEDEIKRIDEEIEELKFKKNQLEDISISLKTAIDILDEAGMEIQRDFAPALNRKMSDIVNKITHKRYSEITVDDGLCLKAIAPETGKLVLATDLSGGTIDQLYLALRISASEIISSTEERLPLFMDEVFAQYDDTRTKETLVFLNELSRGRQVILFTCKEREVDIAAEVCGGNLNVIRLS
ncbi:MAG: AAA family ATPase [Clostridia bacterium]|nr:AAA family ATPase [Clostridia bacterium]